ncbi:MAG: hypothetical protein HYV06_02115 [Deltaproteobacteria bacterium]|nr:hypothetical protein [Deltaproteobacteria bacterium]
MLIIAIGVSTMIAVAIVVFGMQYYAFRKNKSELDRDFGMHSPCSDGIHPRTTSNGSARGTQEVALPS